MKERFFSWRVCLAGICFLTGIDILLFICVVILDAGFGVAPQFGLLMATSLILMLSTLTVIGLRSSHQSKEKPTGSAINESSWGAAGKRKAPSGKYRPRNARETSVQLGRPNQVGAPTTWRSVMTIRRRNTAAVPHKEEISYEATSTTP